MMRRRLPALVVAIACGGAFAADLPPLPIESPGHVETLPQRYPPHWFWIFDPAFAHMLDGKLILVDAATDDVHRRVRGTLNISLMGNFIASRSRPELYAIESFASRGTRGTRTDVLTIYDTRTLAPTGEIVWPTPKRFQGLPHRNAMALIDGERWLLVFNFDPATSVTVIDTQARRITAEVETPGCAMIYPTGKRGFSSLCADGTMLTTQLDPAGRVASRSQSAPFFDSERTPVLDRPALVDGRAYFFGFTGQVHTVNLRGEKPVFEKPWSLVTDEERKQNWRPGGLTQVTWNAAGRFYVLMHPDGRDGSHSGGGSQVWVFDAATHERVQRLALKSWGLSLGIGGGAEPWLLVTTPEMTVEVYDAKDGRLLRTIGKIGQETPLYLDAAGAP
jgi:methylamine dehydrogenase heavy chain